MTQFDYSLSEQRWTATVMATFLPLQDRYSKLTSQGATWNGGKSRFQSVSSPRLKRETPLSQPSAASQRAATLITRQKQETLERDHCTSSRAVETPRSKLKNTAGKNNHCWAGFSRRYAGITLRLGHNRFIHYAYSMTCLWLSRELQ